MLSLTSKSRMSLLVGVVLAAGVSAPIASAANHVRVDTISNIAPGTTNLQIGVYVTNDEPVTAIVLPLEIRSCGNGAYITGPTFSHGMNHEGRMYNSSLSPDADSAGRWPASIFVTHTFAADSPTTALKCPRWFDPSRAWSVPSAAPDFISPDAIFMATVSTGDPGIGEESDLAPGSDPPGVPSYRITVNVGMSPGQFVIDTTCVEPANILEFIADASNPHSIRPTFGMGIIGVGIPIGPCEPIGCSCPCHGDPVDCAGPPLGILDIVSVVDVAFRGVPAVQGPFCPYFNTDVDCSGVTDIVDVVKSVNVEFRGGDPAVEYCNPCAASGSSQAGPSHR